MLAHAYEADRAARAVVEGCRAVAADDTLRQNWIEEQSKSAKRVRRGEVVILEAESTKMVRTYQLSLSRQATGCEQDQG